MTELTQTPRPRPGLYTLHTDGGVLVEEGQPGGEAAIGAVLKNSDNLVVEAISKPIGRIEESAIAEFHAMDPMSRRIIRKRLSTLASFPSS